MCIYHDWLIIIVCFYLVCLVRRKKSVCAYITKLERCVRRTFRAPFGYSAIFLYSYQQRIILLAWMCYYARHIIIVVCCNRLIHHYGNKNPSIKMVALNSFKDYARIWLHKQKYAKPRGTNLVIRKIQCLWGKTCLKLSFPYNTLCKISS